MFRFGSPVQPMVSVDRSTILHVLLAFVTTPPSSREGIPHSLI